jgi:hypothetical protein
MIDGKSENTDKVITYRPFPVRLVISILIGAILITSVSVTTHVFAVGQTSTALPTCTDPTGQNLPCMIVISTLPPPPNAIQCQETSGQTLPCSYATQALSNGEQIVAITVYVPANYVFTGYGPWTVVKQIVHETTTKTKIVTRCPDSQILNHTTHKCENIPLPCERPDANAKTDPDTNLKTKDCDLGDANEHIKLPCERPDSNAKTDPDTDLKTMDCDLGDANEHGKTPPLPLSCNSVNYNGTCLPTNNTKTSGGSGAESTCVNNCTAGTPPAVDCTKNPTDPSCSQTLTPSTTTPTTKTCPDGSVIDASATCPTQPSSSNPSNPNTQTPPPGDNNPPPSGSDNGNNNPNKGDNNNGGNPP